MTPLLGTKTSSAPVGDKSVGDTRAARSLFSCALWRGMGRHGRHGPPRAAVRAPSAPATAPFGFSRNTRHETRITAFFRITASLPTISHHFPRFPGISRPPHPPPPIKCPRAGRLSWSAARDCRPRPVAAFLRVVARHGAAMARHGRPPSPAPSTRPVGFLQQRDTQHAFSQSLRRLQGEQPQARPTGFHESRNTRHETRLLFFPTRHFPRFPGISRYFSGGGGCSGTGVQAPLRENPTKMHKIPHPREAAWGVPSAAAPAALQAAWAAANTE